VSLPFLVEAGAQASLSHRRPLAVVGDEQNIWVEPAPMTAPDVVTLAAGSSSDAAIGRPVP
jgi:hypothetical protein